MKSTARCVAGADPKPALRSFAAVTSGWALFLNGRFTVIDFICYCAGLVLGIFGPSFALMALAELSTSTKRKELPHDPD